MRLSRRTNKLTSSQLLLKSCSHCWSTLNCIFFFFLEINIENHAYNKKTRVPISTQIDRNFRSEITIRLTAK